MKHPLFTKAGRTLYLIVWIVITMIQTFVLSLLYNLSLAMSVWDSLIYNGLFLIFGVGYWYVIRYANPDKNDRLGLVIVHLLSCALTLSLWIFASSRITELIADTEMRYLTFSSDAMVGRAILGALYYAVIMLIFYLYIYYQGIRERDQRENVLRMSLQETELRALKSQINPHFIFNSLNSVSSLTLSHPDRAHEMVIKLSDFLRYSLNSEDTQENTLEEELQQVSRYIDIEKVRFGDKLHVEMNTPANTLTGHIPKLILQPLFENAIKFGLYESLDPVTITLNARRTNRILTIEIQNNFDPDAHPAKGEGIGLKNIEERLHVKYDSPDLLKYSTEGNTFTVRMMIPQ